MTPHPDEQAREFLAPYFDMLDALGPAKMNRDVHSAKLGALLARVRLAEAECMYENWNVDESIRRFDAWAKKRVASLRQVAGERTKS